MDKKDESLKYEVAEELGLLDKVRQFGWKSLTAKETGRIGGLITKRKKAMGNANNPGVGDIKNLSADSTDNRQV